MMHALTLEKLVKKPVKDTYGRHLGHVIGYSLDSSGNMKGLGVDHGSSTFQEYPRERILIEGNGNHIVLLPEWKENVDKLRKNTLIVKKRRNYGYYKLNLSLNFFTIFNTLSS